MANITFDLGNASQTARIVDAICVRFGYQAIINGEANPQTKNAFAKDVVIKWLVNQVLEHEGNEAAKIAKEEILANPPIIS